MSRFISGIEKETEDVLTGASVAFHSVVAVDLRFDDNYFTARVAGYVNQQCFECGKKAISVVQYQLQSVPPRGVDVLDWAFKELVGGGAGNSPFSGAQLVYSAEADGSGEVGND